MTGTCIGTMNGAERPKVSVPTQSIGTRNQSNFEFRISNFVFRISCFITVRSVDSYALESKSSDYVPSGGIRLMRQLTIFPRLDSTTVKRPFPLSIT